MLMDLFLGMGVKTAPVPIVDSSGKARSRHNALCWWLGEGVLQEILSSEDGRDVGGMVYLVSIVEENREGGRPALVEG